ncbi:hypothetical protein TRVL_02932 [Trypanosoma vivax]|nr:hypothetical protein TRVL_02932 [Trypanosoma vivax]
MPTKERSSGVFPIGCGPGDQEKLPRGGGMSAFTTLRSSKGGRGVYNFLDCNSDWMHSLALSKDVLATRASTTTSPQTDGMARGGRIMGNNNETKHMRHKHSVRGAPMCVAGIGDSSVAKRGVAPDAVDGLGSDCPTSGVGSGSVSRGGNVKGVLPIGQCDLTVPTNLRKEREKPAPIGINVAPMPSGFRIASDRTWGVFEPFFVKGSKQFAAQGKTRSFAPPRAIGLGDNELDQLCEPTTFGVAAGYRGVVTPSHQAGRLIVPRTREIMRPLPVGVSDSAAELRVEQHLPPQREWQLESIFSGSPTSASMWAAHDVPVSRPVYSDTPASNVDNDQKVWFDFCDEITDKICSDPEYELHPVEGVHQCEPSLQGFASDGGEQRQCTAFLGVSDVQSGGEVGVDDDPLRNFCWIWNRLQSAEEANAEAQGTDSEQALQSCTWAYSKTQATIIPQ